MTDPKEEPLMVTQADQALNLRLLGLSDENRRRREEGKPIVDVLQLLAAHRLSSSPHSPELREALVSRAFGLINVAEQSGEVTSAQWKRDAEQWLAETRAALASPPTGSGDGVVTELAEVKQHVRDFIRALDRGYLDRIMQGR